jgi:hypothetical protein
MSKAIKSEHNYPMTSPKRNKYKSKTRKQGGVGLSVVQEFPYGKFEPSPMEVKQMKEKLKQDSIFHVNNTDVSRVISNHSIHELSTVRGADDMHSTLGRMKPKKESTETNPSLNHVLELIKDNKDQLRGILF